MIPEICPECGHDRFVTSCYRAAGVTTGKTNCQRCGLLVATETPQPERHSWLDDLGLGFLREWFAPAPVRPSAPRRSVPLRPLTPEESHARFAPPIPPLPPAPAPAPSEPSPAAAPPPADVYRTWGPSPATVEEPTLEEGEPVAPPAPAEAPEEEPPEGQGSTSATIIMGPLTPLEAPPSELTEPVPMLDEASAETFDTGPMAPVPTAPLSERGSIEAPRPSAPEPASPVALPERDERAAPSPAEPPAAPIPAPPSDRQARTQTVPMPVPRLEPSPPPSLLGPEAAPTAAPSVTPSPVPSPPAGEGSPPVPAPSVPEGGGHATAPASGEVSATARTEPLPAQPLSEVRSQMESCDSGQLSAMLGRSSALGWSPAVYELVQQILRERQFALPSTAPEAPEEEARVVPVRPPTPPTAPLPIRPAPAPPTFAPVAAPVPAAAPTSAPAPAPVPAPVSPPLAAPAPRAVPRVLVPAGRPRRVPTIAPVELPAPTGDALCDPLIDHADAQLYQTNAFRVAGLPVDATPREVSRQAEKLRMLEKLGHTPATIGGALALDPPPSADDIREAMQRLAEPERRLLDELLWIWAMLPGGTAQDEALLAFGAGETDAALERWFAGETRPGEAPAARHNLAVVHHVRALDLERRAVERNLTKEEREERDACWAEAAPRWRAIVTLEPFWTRVTERVRALDDPRLTAGAVRRVRGSLPLALLLVDASLARAAAERGEERECERHHRRMRDFGLGAALVEEAHRRAAIPVWEQVQQLCRAAEPKADADPAHADRVTRDLLRQAAPLLRTLDLLLPEGHATRVGAHDEVALRALACQIAFGNKTEDWTTSLALLKAILPIASSSSAKGRIEDNLRIVERNLQFATCWFCKKKPSEDKASVSLEMYGNVVRTPVWNGVRVQWQKVTLLVPRCGECKKRQGQASAAMVLGVLGGLGAGGLLALITGGHPAGLFIGFLFAVAGITLGAVIRSSALAGIRDEAYKSEFPTVKEKRSEGWEFGSGPQG